MSDTDSERHVGPDANDAVQVLQGETASSNPEKATDAAPSIPRAIYLDKLLRNIAVMLDYANKSGVTLPDELGQKLDQLLVSPEVAGHKDMFSKI